MSTERKGKFVISIDLEYAWGFWDHDISEEQKEKIKQETDIVHRLLSLFDLYKIPATWAVVGKLLEEGEDPLWHDTDGVVKKIQVGSVNHEIGSHSYAHILYGESEHSEIESDIEKAQEIHSQRNLPFNSFIFPRNSEGGHEMLAQHGIQVYRGKQRTWRDSLPDSLRRVANFLSFCVPLASTVTLTRHSSGLLNIPASLLFLGRNGVRNLVPPFCMEKKIKNGLERAARKGEIFHLWFHPSNFSYATDTQFRILEQILIEARNLREGDELDTVTMGSIVNNYEEH